MTAPTTHPLAAAYLHDLELLLHGVEPGERAEVLAGVREHLEGAVGPGASDDEVRAALAELGPPQAIADEAYAGRSPEPARAPSAPPAPARGAISRPWVPIVVACILGLGLLTLVAVALGGLGYSTETVVSSDGEVKTRVTEFDSTMVLFALPWHLFTVALPVAALTVPSPLWTRAERIRMIAVAPLSLVLIAGLPAIGYAITRTEIGINVGAWISLAVIIIAAVWIFGRDIPAGLRRASAPSSPLVSRPS
ncbi:HAAS signaling domain-containing protein [Knoellia koreensis]|uniref:DUF1700 domain-containing protein n=1 Tax=Knoellia koreensis TaxID=2730921 RepID=A0A849H9J0_9MICO|nr:hypothetical protein [Knoellia sp. DB2414S]NNM46540.1 hypothetical protein [Knoellia sp. DB2414S]